jgi:thiamine biosynthesis lipoprotein
MDWSEAKTAKSKPITFHSDKQHWQLDMFHCMGCYALANAKSNTNRLIPHVPAAAAVYISGIVKEYAADLVVEMLRQSGINHGLVDMGGDIAVIGPHPDNSPWQVAISDPDFPEQAIATIPLMAGGLASSGDYQRFIVLNDERYCHILNPKTGWPVKGLAAVSVWAPQCVVAGTVATIAMLKGDVEGEKWLQDVGCNYVTVNRSGIVNCYPNALVRMSSHL